MMVRDFQCVIGNEAKVQMPEMIGRQPDAVIACVGGGSNAIGMFYPYIEEKSVQIIGVEAGGHGIASGSHAAPLTANAKVGVLHGNKVYLMQDENGQIIETHSISAGLDYPGVGPEHCLLKDMGRAQYVAINDDEAIGCIRCAVPFRRHHPRAGIQPCPGACDQDRADHGQGQGAAGEPVRPRRQGYEYRRQAEGDHAMSRIQTTFDKLKQQQRKALIPFITAGDPSQQLTVPLMHGLVAAGADVLELGVPFSDPMADGPTIQRASERALKNGMSLRGVLGMVAEFRKQDTTTPVVLMGYGNPIEAMGWEDVRAALCRSRRGWRADGGFSAGRKP